MLSPTTWRYILVIAVLMNLYFLITNLVIGAPWYLDALSIVAIVICIYPFVQWTKVARMNKQISRLIRP